MPSLGLNEHGVGLVENEQYETIVPQAIRDSLSALYEKVKSGKVVPFSAMLDQEKWAEIRDEAAKPVE